MAELVSRSVRKMAHADWLLRGSEKADMLPASYGGGNFELIWMKIKEKHENLRQILSRTLS